MRDWDDEECQWPGRSSPAYDGASKLLSCQKLKLKGSAMVVGRRSASETKLVRVKVFDILVVM